MFLGQLTNAYAQPQTQFGREMEKPDCGPLVGLDHRKPMGSPLVFVKRLVAGFTEAA